MKQTRVLTAPTELGPLQTLPEKPFSCLVQLNGNNFSEHLIPPGLI